MTLNDKVAETVDPDVSAGHSPADEPSSASDDTKSTVSTANCGSAAALRDGDKTVETVVLAASAADGHSIAAAQDTNARGDSGLGSPRAKTVETVVLEQRPAETPGQNHSFNSGTVESVAPDPRDKVNYEGDGPWRYAENVVGRVFTIMSDLVHPDTGAVLATAEGVDQAAARRGNTRSAWIIHDKDEWDAGDVADNPRAVLGGVKPTHFHAVEEHKHQTTLGVVARAYGVPPNFVEVKKGRGVFEDCAEYLTHENPNQRERGKHLYSDDEVTAYGFNFRETVDARVAERKAGGGKKNKRTDVDKLALQVLEDGMTIDEARKADPLAFSRGRDRIRKMRGEYLAAQEPPATRINFYIHGPGGVGKDLLARALARTLAAEEVEAGRPAYFTAGGDNVAFQHYDGEPVVIWEDARPGKMMKAVGGRGDLFAVLNPFPEKVAVNVKNSSTQLINRVNIITGALDSEEFLNALAGEYVDRYGTAHKAEDSSQAWRRFPIIIPVREDEFDLLINKGFLYNSREFKEYECYRGLRQRMQAGLTRLDAITDESIRAKGKRELEQRTTRPVVEQYERLTGGRADADQDDEAKLAEVLAEFEDVGTAVSATDAEVRAQERKARLADAEARARCQAQADGFTACRIQMDGDQAVRYMALPDPNTPSGWGVNEGGELDMSLWDFETETYNGQPARRWEEISDEFLSDHEQTVARDRRKELV